MFQDKKADEATKHALQDVLARLEGFDDKDMHEVCDSKSHFLRVFIEVI